MEFLLVLALVVWSGAIVCFVRNHFVYKYRTSLIDQISEASKHDINNGNYNYQWRYHMYDTVSYNEMVLKFWKPLDSFYPDKAFIRS